VHKQLTWFILINMEIIVFVMINSNFQSSQIGHNWGLQSSFIVITMGHTMNCHISFVTTIIFLDVARVLIGQHLSYYFIEIN
jgi:hypothetical protein